MTRVASKGEILSLEAIGYADVGAGKPMRTDSLFWIASIFKPIAATAVMMLADEGKVRLDDPVKAHLSEFTPRIMRVSRDGTEVGLYKPPRAPTVRQLLSHQGGLPFSSAFENPPEAALCRRAMRPHSAAKP